MKIKKIIFTGGHQTSAIPVIEELEKYYLGKYKIYWFGHKYASSINKSVSAEYKQISLLEIPFYPIYTPKFYKQFIPLSLIKLIFAVFQSIELLLKIKPSLIVSFGGYLAVPVVIAAYILRIKILTHEQTVVAGWANKVIGILANRVLVSWESSLKHFSKSKAVLVGIPLSKNIVRSNKIEKLFNNNLTTLFITGGKQGAHTINETIFNVLPRLLKSHNVIHQTGSHSVYKDLEKFLNLKESLNTKLKKRYLVADYFLESEFDKILISSDIVISRSGAHTVYKLLFLRKFGILIPIPKSSHNEQMLNAQELKNSHLGVIIKQKDLTPKTLIKKLEFVKKMSKKNINSLNLPNNGVQKFVEEIEKLLPKT